MIPPLTPPLKPRGEDQIEHAAILSDHHQPVNQIEFVVIFGGNPLICSQTHHHVLERIGTSKLDLAPASLIEFAVIFYNPLILSNKI